MKQLFSMILMTMIVLSSCNFSYEGKAEKKEFRAVWVSTILGLDYPSSPTTDANSLKAQTNKILDECRNMGMNAVIFQVRPSSDAFYPSGIFPWSAYLTGSQGTPPVDGFDPLKYWIDAAHERGIELHAWLNPYRVASSEEEYNQMVEGHIAKKNPDWVVKHSDGKYYFNPGIPQVIEIVKDGVKEIVDNYDVDGIHIDDYFYPSKDYDDEQAFNTYKGEFKNKDDWRRNNNDVLVYNLGKIVREANKDIIFGVSPSGIWANKSNLEQGSNTSGKESYFSLYADTRKWVKEGYVDYICPQIYWYIGYDGADYKTLVNWWADVVSGTNVKLYIGMADYKACNADSNSPWYGINAIKQSINLNKTIPQITGEVHFRYKFLVDKKEINDFYKKEYNKVSKKPILNKDNHNSYIVGIDGAFMSEKPLSRAETTTLLARLIVDENGNKAFDEQSYYETSFNDVSKDSWYSSAIGFMEQFDVITGYDDGTFLPLKQITRAEFASLVSRFETLDNNASHNFSDVSNDFWASPYIAHAVSKGYIDGYPDKTFKPNENITRAQAVKVINRLLSRVPNKEYIDQTTNLNPFSDLSNKHWAYYEIMEAAYNH